MHHYRFATAGGVPTAALVLLFVTAQGCASAGSAGGPGAEPAATPTTAAITTWPSVAREHVDLWLHGYAMLSRDTALVPLFARGYRERMAAMKAQRNLTTQLDANLDRLTARLAANPALVNGQFAPLYFASFTQMRDITRLFLQAEGDIRATNDPATQTLFAVLAGSFPSAADREWLRQFMLALEDERNRYYQTWWSGEQAARAATRAAFDSLWQGVHRPRMQRFLNNTSNTGGEVLLSLTLGGEGRTIMMGGTRNAVGVGHPDVAEPVQGVYVFAHEAVSTIASTAIEDHTTPAERRSGVTARYASNVAVRGGALLLQKTSPELVPGYMRYYLRTSGATAPSGDPAAAFAARFPVPENIVDAVRRQIDVVMGGI